MVRLKHIFLLILTLAFAVGNAFGQRLALLEAEVYGGEEAEYLWPVTIPTDDGGFIISILSESTKEGNLNFSCSIGFERSLVQKYNNQGGMEWERCYTHTSDSAYLYYFPLSDGSRVLGGTGHFSPMGRHWRIRKEDRDGNILWSKGYGGSRDEFLRDMIATDDGGYILLGDTYSDDGDVDNHLGGYFLSDIWALKVDSNGNKEWNRVIGGSHEDNASAVIAAPDGGCYIAGGTYSNDYDCMELHGTPGNYPDAFVARLDGSGNLLWSRCLGGVHSDWAYDLCGDGKGGILIAATAGSGDGDVSHDKGGHNFWLVNMDGSGNILWDNCYGGTYARGAAVCRGTDGSIWMGGVTGEGASGEQVDEEFGYDDAWVMRTDAAGNFLGGRVLGAPRGDEIKILHPLESGIVMAGGHVGLETGGWHYPGGTFSTVYGWRDVFLARIAPWTTGIEETKNDVDIPIAIYPNPASERAVIEVAGGVAVTITDMAGRQVCRQEAAEGAWTVDVRNWGKGIYHVQVSSERGYRTTGKLIVQ